MIDDFLINFFAIFSKEPGNFIFFNSKGTLVPSFFFTDEETLHFLFYFISILGPIKGPHPSVLASKILNVATTCEL